MPTDLRHEAGPFDVIGDVHGCRAELEAMLRLLGYAITRDSEGRAVGASHTAGRTAVFLGDLINRGPDTPGVLRLLMGMVGNGTALCVLGNHDEKVLHALSNPAAHVKGRLARSLAQLGAQPAVFRKQVEAFIGGLRPHHLLDGGRLVVVHAGLPESLHGQDSDAARRFCLYGESGEMDESGRPLRPDWVKGYRGGATVLYGHTPKLDPQWVNNTMCLDTGCVFGGWLTALRYPDRELVRVPAARVYQKPKEPFLAALVMAQSRASDR